jgi:DNA polymerase I-like protein with 3'-5' exonuclease and polymerase domains
MQTSLLSQSDMASVIRHLRWAEAPKDYAAPTKFPDLSNEKRLSIDLESHDPELQTRGAGWRRDAYILGTSVTTDSGYSEYYPMRHTQGPNCDPDKVMRWLKDTLSHYTGTIVGANLLYDLDGLQVAGIKAPYATFQDIQFAEPLLDENAISYSLDTLAKNYLKRTKLTRMLEKLYGETVMSNFREVHPGHASLYAKEDSKLALEILDKQLPRLASEELSDLFALENRLIPILLYMKAKGVRVDLERAEQVDKILAAKRDEALHRMNKIARFEVDPNSGQSLAKACDQLGISYQHTDKGNPSFGGLWLKAQTHEFFVALQAARKYEKARNPFITNYILGSHVNGRIHADFHPLRNATSEDDERGTRSGRFSSSHPNLQNIPERDEEIGPLLRSLFIPEEGCQWWSADYSQIEFRLLVHFAVLCKCKGAEEAAERYRKDPKTDFHIMVSEITGLDRKPAKNLNFGLIYKIGKDKFARILKLADEDGKATKESEKLKATYHAKVPFIKGISDLATGVASEKGFVRTLLGRRSRFVLWEPDEKNGYLTPPQPLETARAWGKPIRRAKTYKGLNRILQGSSADILKVALVQLWDEKIIGEGSPLTLSLTVHDENDGSMEAGERGEKYLAQAKEIMEQAIPLQVPVIVNCGLGKNWSEAK